jgi:hypothetical protein
MSRVVIQNEILENNKEENTKVMNKIEQKYTKKLGRL